jgi:hypothetical protein
MLWLLFIFSSLLTLVVVASLYAGARPNSWPTTTGKVLSSRVTHLQEKLLTRGPGFHFYRPQVGYEYSVGDKTYRSIRLGNFLGFGNNPQLANDIIARFPENQAATVYYHPFFSGLSALIPGVQQLGMHILMLLFGATLTLISGVVLFA